MREVLPGVWHWSVYYEKIRTAVSSYYLSDLKFVIDPLLPRDEEIPFAAGVEHVLLSNRHHYRDSAALVERFGCPVWCVEEGLHELRGKVGVKGFRFGDTLPGGIKALRIAGICPDETALLLPGPGEAVALADGVIRRDDGPLEFVPDQYMGEDPQRVKTDLRAAYSRMLAEHPCDALLLAHGDPWIGGAGKALAAFIA